jgi:hypothetical protein
MLNPFVKFELRFIEAFRKLKKRYLVMQLFDRAQEETKRSSKCVILSHYSDAGNARIHHKNILYDPYAALLDLESEQDRKRLAGMLAKESGYLVFSSLIIDHASIKRALNQTLKEKCNRYFTEKQLLPAGARTVRPVVELSFGELFITLKYGAQTIRVKLAEIEKAY